MTILFDLVMLILFAGCLYASFYNGTKKELVRDTFLTTISLMVFVKDFSEWLN